MLHKSLITLAVFLGLSALANTDPVTEKLKQVADLQPPELTKVMGSYSQLYDDLQNLRVRPSGRTTTAHDKLIREAYERHRIESLEYVRPNQYRRWMVVAVRWLPIALTRDGRTYIIDQRTPVTLGKENVY